MIDNYIFTYTEKENGIRYLYSSLDNDPDDYMSVLAAILNGDKMWWCDRILKEKGI